MSLHDHTNRVIVQTDTAALACRSLAALGIEVESVQCGGVRPVIWVHPGPATRKLRSAVYRRETIRGRLHCTYTAPVAGCQVRWRASERPDPLPTPTIGKRPALGVAA